MSMNLSLELTFRMHDLILGNPDLILKMLN